MAGHSESSKHSLDHHHHHHHHHEDGNCESHTFSVTIVNGGNRVWKFLLYQTHPTKSDVVPAWFVSPEIPVGDKITFSWKAKYSFVWSEVEKIRPGATFHATGHKECDPKDKNVVNFSFCDDTPHLSDAFGGEEKGTLTIIDGDNIPPNRFAVGVSMSGKTIYVANAKSKMKHVFIPRPNYWINAMNEVTEGMFMDIKTITQSGELKFPHNVFELTATLQKNNTWKIEH
jgi:hypothetical protein